MAKIIDNDQMIIKENEELQKCIDQIQLYGPNGEFYMFSYRHKKDLQNTLEARKEWLKPIEWTITHE